MLLMLEKCKTVIKMGMEKNFGWTIHNSVDILKMV